MDEDPPGVVYFYAPGRGGEYAEHFLDGFDGILQVDGYTGYNRLPAAGPGNDRPAKLATRLRSAPPTIQLGGETVNALTFKLDQSTGQVMKGKP